MICNVSTYGRDSTYHSKWLVVSITKYSHIFGRNTEPFELRRSAESTTPSAEPAAAGTEPTAASTGPLRAHPTVLHRHRLYGGCSVRQNVQNANLERALTALTSKMGVELEPVEVRLPKDLEALGQVTPLAAHLGVLKQSPPQVEAARSSGMGFRGTSLAPTTPMWFQEKALQEEEASCLRALLSVASCIHAGVASARLVACLGQVPVKAEPVVEQEAENVSQFCLCGAEFRTRCRCRCVWL